jgi:hypothetical protein
MKSMWTKLAFSMVGWGLVAVGVFIGHPYLMKFLCGLGVGLLLGWAIPSLWFHRD